MRQVSQLIVLCYVHLFGLAFNYCFCHHDHRLPNSSENIGDCIRCVNKEQRASNEAFCRQHCPLADDLKVRGGRELAKIKEADWTDRGRGDREKRDSGRNTRSVNRRRGPFRRRPGWTNNGAANRLEVAHQNYDGGYMSVKRDLKDQMNAQLENRVAAPVAEWINGGLEDRVAVPVGDKMKNAYNDGWAAFEDRVAVHPADQWANGGLEDRMAMPVGEQWITGGLEDRVAVPAVNQMNGALVAATTPVSDDYDPGPQEENDPWAAFEDRVGVHPGDQWNSGGLEDRVAVHTSSPMNSGGLEDRVAVPLNNQVRAQVADPGSTPVYDDYDPGPQEENDPWAAFEDRVAVHPGDQWNSGGLEDRVAMPVGNQPQAQPIQSVGQLRQSRHLRQQRRQQRRPRAFSQDDDNDSKLTHMLRQMQSFFHPEPLTEHETGPQQQSADVSAQQIGADQAYPNLLDPAAAVDPNYVANAMDNPNNLPPNANENYYDPNNPLPNKPDSFNPGASQILAITGLALFMLGALLSSIFYFVSKSKAVERKSSKKKRKSIATEGGDIQTSV